MAASPPITEAQRAAIARGDFHAPKWLDRLATVPRSRLLTPWWKPLIPHPEQVRIQRSPARFKVVAAGRRSGKTDIVKREGVRRALGPQKNRDARYVFAAPVYTQAKSLYWDHLKDAVPKWALDKRRGIGGISESELTIWLRNGARLMVVGMDRPQRLEGAPVDWIVLDEYAEMRPTVWKSTVRPMLSEIGREGVAWFIGRPKGRNHFYELATAAQKLDDPAWDYATWSSADILDPDEVAQARRDSDELTFRQEYDADWITFTGRAYYAFDRAKHAIERVHYDPQQPLILAFDFNVEPGIAIYLQEQKYEGKLPNVAPQITAAIGEVYIRKNSNTVLVCNRILADWGPGGAIAEHRGEVHLYGDATGGARGTAKVRGSDWDIIREMLRPVFGGRLKDYVRRANPAERARVNAVNSRLCSADGTIRFLADPVRAANLIHDLDNVTVVEGGSGEIDKKADPTLSHASDAAGYYLHDRWGVVSTPKLSTSALY